MNSINGSTWFGIRLDNSRLSQDAQRSNQIFRGIGNNAQAEGARIDSIFRRAGMAAGAFLTIQQAAKFASQIATVRGEFQQLEVAFTTLLQSKAKADALMEQMVQTSIKTPFSLQDVAGGAKQLIAYGFASEGVNDTLIRLGNIAAGLSLPLERLTYLYGTTMTQGRLYTRDLMQFTTSGIPMLQGLADLFGVTTGEVNKLVEEGKVGFPEVEKVIKNLTSEGGKFFNLMEEQSKTITGQISNLKDEISLMLNEIGKENQDTISAVIAGASNIVQNYEDIGRVIAVLIITYGTYKAALMAVLAAQKLAIVAQMAREWYAMGKALGFATANQVLFNSASRINPYIMIASVLVGVVSALVLFGQATNKAADEQERLNEVMDAAELQTTQEIQQIERLRNIVKDGNKEYTARKNALDELKKLVPDYHASLTTEGKLINDNSEALETYIKRLKLTAQIRVASDKLGQASTNESDYINSLTKREKEAILRAQSLPKFKEDMSPTTDDDRMRASGLAPVAYRTITNALKSLQEQKDQYSALIDKWTADLMGIKPATTGPDTDPGSDKENAKKAADKAKKDQEQKLRDDLVDIKKSETTDKIKLIEIERDAAIDAIKQEKAEYEAMAKTAGIKKPDTTVFEKRIDAKNAIAKAKINQANEETTKEQTDEEKKKLDSLLSQYRTFEGKRTAIDAEHANDIETLNAALLKATTDAERKAINGSIEARKAAYQESLAALESEALQSTGFYQELFNEISDKGYRTLTDLAKRTSEVLAGARTTKGADGKDMITLEIPSIDAAGNQVKKAVTITLEEFARLKDKAQEVSQAIESRNPFNALIDAVEKLKNAKNKNEASDAMELVAKAASGTMSEIKAWGNLIGSVFGDEVGEGVDQIMNLVSGMADLGVGIGRMAAGDILGGVTQAAQGIANIITQIVDITKQQKMEQIALMAAEMDYQRQLEERRMKLIESRSQMAAYANDVELLNKLIKAGYIEEGAADYWSQLSDKLSGSKNSMIQELINQERIWNKLQNEKSKESGWVGLNYYIHWTSLKGMNAEQIELLYNQDKLTEEARKYFEQWKASGESIEKLQDDIANLYEEMSSLVTGMNFDTFLDEAINQLVEARGDIANFADYTEETIKNALLNAFKYQYLAGQIKGLYDKLAEAMINEQADEAFVKNWVDEYNKTLGDSWEQLKDVFEKAGLSANDISDTRKAATKGIEGISQDSADELNGRFAVIQGHTFQLATNTARLVEVGEQQLSHLAAISNNTKRLEGIEGSLKSMRTTIDDISRNGLIMK